MKKVLITPILFLSILGAHGAGRHHSREFDDQMALGRLKANSSMALQRDAERFQANKEKFMAGQAKDSQLRDQKSKSEAQKFEATQRRQELAATAEIEKLKLTDSREARAHEKEMAKLELEKAKILASGGASSKGRATSSRAQAASYDEEDFEEEDIDYSPPPVRSRASAAPRRAPVVVTAEEEEEDFPVSKPRKPSGITPQGGTMEIGAAQDKVFDVLDTTRKTFDDVYADWKKLLVRKASTPAQKAKLASEKKEISDFLRGSEKYVLSLEEQNERLEKDIQRSLEENKKRSGVTKQTVQAHLMQVKARNKECVEQVEALRTYWAEILKSLGLTFS